MSYPKIKEYLQTIYGVFKMVHQKSVVQKDKRMSYIALSIYNYLLKVAKDFDVDLKTIEVSNSVNMLPFFEYIEFFSIPLYDFSTIKESDVDVNNNRDIERYVLTNIYYITQQQKMPTKV